MSYVHRELCCENGGCLIGAEGIQFFEKLRIRVSKNGYCKEGGIGCASLTDSKGSNGDSGGHLDDRQK